MIGLHERIHDMGVKRGWELNEHGECSKRQSCDSVHRHIVLRTVPASWYCWYYLCHGNVDVPSVDVLQHARELRQVDLVVAVQIVPVFQSGSGFRSDREVH